MGANFAYNKPMSVPRFNESDKIDSLVSSPIRGFGLPNGRQGLSGGLNFRIDSTYVQYSYSRMREIYRYSIYCRLEG